MKKNSYFYWLDLLRFFAAFAVVACHYRGAFFVDYTSLPAEQQGFTTFLFYSISRLGHEAVLIFFVLSGFLVGGKGLERILDKSFRPINYAIDRAVRIQLPLISSLFIYLPICILIDKPIILGDWIGSIFSLQGIFCIPAIEVLWSLSYEVWFYIMLCAFGYIIKHHKSGKAIIGYITLFISFLVFTKLNTTYLFIWLLGALSFFLVHYNKKYILYISLVSSIALMVLLQLTSGSRIMADTDIQAGLSYRSLIEIMFGLTISIFISQIAHQYPKYIWSCRIENLGKKLAVFSYTLYLTHVPVMRLLQHLNAPRSTTLNAASLSMYVAWMCIAIITSYCVYYIFERNTRKVKQYIHSLIKRK